MGGRIFQGINLFAWRDNHEQLREMKNLEVYLADLSRQFNTTEPAAPNSVTGAPNDLTYITVSNESGLSKERRLNNSGAITLTDNGANSTMVIGLNQALIDHGNLTGRTTAADDDHPQYVRIAPTADTRNVVVPTGTLKLGLRVNGNIGLDATAHATERRLTGKIQAMMSDTRLRGRVAWLLMTARIHLLSPDIRRPGRVGDLIIPVLDPQGEDRKAFIRWVLGGVMKYPAEDDVAALDQLTEGYSAAAFASLRSDLKAKSPDDGGEMEIGRIVEIVGDHIPPAIGATREYQTLQALINCTRRSLLPESDSPSLDIHRQREQWESRIRALEAMGIR